MGTDGWEYFGWRPNVLVCALMSTTISPLHRYFGLVLCKSRWRLREPITAPLSLFWDVPCSFLPQTHHCSATFHRVKRTRKHDCERKNSLFPKQGLDFCFKRGVSPLFILPRVWKHERYIKKVHSVWSYVTSQQLCTFPLRAVINISGKAMKGMFVLILTLCGTECRATPGEFRFF